MKDSEKLINLKEAPDWEDCNQILEILQIGFRRLESVVAHEDFETALVRESIESCQDLKMKPHLSTNEKVKHCQKCINEKRKALLDEYYRTQKLISKIKLYQSQLD